MTLSNEEIIAELPVPRNQWINHVISGQPEFLSNDTIVKVQFRDNPSETHTSTAGLYDWDISDSKSSNYRSDIVRYQVLSDAE